MQVLVLASGSPHRAAMLRRLNLPFSQMSPGTDETAGPDELPRALAGRLARDKALAVRDARLWNEPVVIIGSDQVAALGTARLRKPGSEDRARAQLARMSGQTVHFFTALCLVDTATGREFSALDTTIVRLRRLSDAEIDQYIAIEQPLDCAGSFKVESLGISLFDAVDSQDPTALVGLPLISLCHGLRKFGIAIP